LVVGDIGTMVQFADASFDVVGSDTVVAMLGVELHRPFSEMLRVLRPGGALVLRELLPPCPDGTTRRDLFLRVMLSARTLMGDGYAMLPPALVASVVRDVGFNQVTYRTVHEPEEEPVPPQWHPLGSHGFPLAQTFVDHYLAQSSGCTVSGGSVADSYLLVARRPDDSG
jgi:SAM-dependent methyltransferase